MSKNKLIASGIFIIITPLFFYAFFNIDSRYPGKHFFALLLMIVGMIAALWIGNSDDKVANNTKNKES
ncbi:MAG: hypothetical protein COB85_06350 [Bacteroidetes bacterium]|nr:MAG: hypothetical protein COB85_06350 [Bacteroidota bacterium]